MGEKASGKVEFSLKLDEQAASAIRRDSYKSISLSEVFKTKELKDAGFKVDVNDNTNGDPSEIFISASFKNKKELDAILQVLAPPDVLSSEIIAKTSILDEKRSSKITVDIPRLRASYLDSREVRTAVEEAGIEFSEFEDVIDDAMKATTLEVELAQDSKLKSAKFTGETSEKKTIEIDSERIRTSYLIKMSAAIVCGLIGIVLLWRLCRTPRLLSKKKKKKDLHSALADLHEANGPRINE